MKRPRFAARRAFTLIDVMIAVAIISLLMAVAAPKYAIAVKNAKLARVAGDCQALATATLMYYADTGEWPRLQGGDRTNKESYLAPFGAGLTGWRGPYMQKWPRSPFCMLDAESALNYRFDYKRVNGVRYAVITVPLTGHPGFAALLADLDRFIDSGDGPAAGKVMWNAGSQWLNWIIEKDPTNVKDVAGNLVTI